MPWTVRDVDKFKKGLSDAQKRQWVKIANSVLARCLARNGSEESCDASAIRQANGSVGTNAITDFYESAIQTNNYELRQTTLDGKKHIVVPVVMMKEGVHNGSWGPIFHRSEELSKFIEAWNGIPVTISHPENREGMNVSANSPEILDSLVVGRVFNTHYSNGLRADVWLDVEKLRTVSPLALSYIMEKRPLEVSVGVFSDAEYTEGEWNGETYEAVAINYRPDHLALLPGEVGACSWTDGCGIRVNKKGGDLMKDLLKTFKELNQEGYAVVPINNAQGYRELLQSLQSELDSMDTSDRVHYLQEVYEDYFIYAIHTQNGGETLYKRGYSVSDNGEIDFGDSSPVEVRRKIEYVTMQRIRTNFNIFKQQKKMDKKDGDLCCEGKVDALISNKLTHFTATDKEWLMGLEESQIDKLSPMEPPKKEETKTVSPQVNKEDVLNEFKNALKTIDDYTALMPKAMKAQVDSGVKLYKEHRETLVKGVLDNTGDNFSKEKLESMDDETLEAIFKSVKQADYSAQGIQDNIGNDEEEVLLPVGVRFATKKEE